MNELLADARKKLSEANKILILTGAGLSTESGIPDFRSPEGLYSVDFHGYNPETILSHRFYKNHPGLFYDYLRTRLNYTDIRPGESYQMLAELENDGRVLAVLTQNIDSLHGTSGSKHVLELHGTLSAYYCETCARHYEASDMMSENTSFICECGGTIRPDVVLFDESVPKMTEALELAKGTDLLLVLGTSLRVYPVAHIPQLVLEREKPVIIINREPTPYADFRGVLEINDDISFVLKKLLSP